jgi:hypothetical protein
MVEEKGLNKKKVDSHIDSRKKDSLPVCRTVKTNLVKIPARTFDGSLKVKIPTTNLIRLLGVKPHRSPTLLESVNSKERNDTKDAQRNSSEIEFKSINTRSKWSSTATEEATTSRTEAV